MSIEKQLEVLEKALRAGAKVEFSFFNYRTKEDARDLLKELSEEAYSSRKLNDANNFTWYTGSIENMRYSLFFDEDKNIKVSETA